MSCRGQRGPPLHKGGLSLSGLVHRVQDDTPTAKLVRQVLGAIAEFEMVTMPIMRTGRTCRVERRAI